ncbi:glycoside hydrolase family 2 TIM barrel-domain containing protein [Microbacterium gilvum]|uniref:Glycoside hydrolase family 2 TIM barrel-domain containing protein n=1 Tax=Microbacterium gilvum TaxID=1336204 RepID=A0ABP9AGR2_9MICO
MTVIPFTSDWQVREPVGPFTGVFGETGTRAVRLPHDALRDEARTPDAPGRGAGAYFPRGAYTYLKTFEVPEEWRGRTVALEVQGAFRRAQVFVDDELAGNRADGYARFLVDLTPYLRFGGTSTLRIEVRAGEDSRWYSGAGLHRPVQLHVDEPVHIVPDGVRIGTVRIEDDQAVVEYATSVRSTERTTRTVRIRSEVVAPDGAVVERDETPITLAPGETGVVRQRFFIADPLLWGPENPALYRSSVRIVDGGDAVEQRFGIRTITVDPRKGLRINGEPVLLRGACVHHDNGPLGAAAIGRAEERRIELLRDAGFNAIRASHNPVSVAMLDACDRLGMLVVDEAFDMWTRFKTPYDYAAEFPQWWAADLEAMVAKDRNHPSVILYSLGNEIAEVGTPHGARWARRMAEHVRALDPSRPITNGVNALLAAIDEVPQVVEELGGLNAAATGGDDLFNAVGASDAASARIEESSAVLDVLGLNYADARYAADAVAHPHRVIVGSETFAAQIGRLWPLVVANDNVIGDFTWTGWDYLGEVGIGSVQYADDPGASGQLEREFPWLTAWSGDLDITGWRRPVSYYREIVYGLRSEPYIAVRRPSRHGVEVVSPSPWAWSDSVSSWTWTGFEGAPVEVEVYAAGDRVVLLLDGAEVGRAEVGAERPRLAVVSTTYRPGELTAVAYDGDVEVGRTAIRSAGTPRLTATADRVHLAAGDADLAFVAIELRDADGALAADAEADVEVTVEGSGVLAGMCSARPATTERFDASTWRTFDGRALAVVRPDGEGDITVRVRAADEEVVLALRAG